MSDRTSRRPWGRPTIYKGIRMRSRLEARFAAGLDRAMVAFADVFDPAGWDYEPVCFADENGQYLPDFAYRMLDTRSGKWTQVYVEVKPRVDDDDYWKTVTDRMAIIWASEPEAVLQLCEFDGELRVWQGVCYVTAGGAGHAWWTLTSPPALPARLSLGAVRMGPMA
jgi:hypothetical protein